MTRIKLDRLGLHSLGQEAFEIRIDRRSYFDTA
jgi:hypothetical protein